jgi:hypothetical protein
MEIWIFKVACKCVREDAHAGDRSLKVGIRREGVKFPFPISGVILEIQNNSIQDKFQT